MNVGPGPRLSAAQQALLSPPPHADSESLFLVRLQGRWAGVYCLYAGSPARALALLNAAFCPPRRLLEQGDRVFLLPGLEESKPLERGAAEGPHMGLYEDLYAALEGPAESPEEELWRVIRGWCDSSCIRHVYTWDERAWTLVKRDPGLASGRG